MRTVYYLIEILILTLSTTIVMIQIERDKKEGSHVDPHKFYAEVLADSALVARHHRKSSQIAQFCKLTMVVSLLVAFRNEHSLSIMQRKVATNETPFWFNNKTPSLGNISNRKT